MQTKHVRTCLGMAAILVVATGAACGDNKTITCRANLDCLQGSIPGRCLLSAGSSDGFCAFPDPSCPSGERYGVASGDGLAGMCVVGAEADAGPLADASVDATPVVPVTNGQAADLVLGQPDFTHSDGNPVQGPYSARTTIAPNSVTAGAGRLWVTEAVASRAQQWNSYPVVNQQAANVVIGQGSSTIGPRVLGPFPRLSTDGRHVFVADSQVNRVLIWNAIPTSDHAAADLVLGQTTFTTSGSGAGAGELNVPASAWSDGTLLVVADALNSRVLIWKSFPTSNGQPADLVLGQPDFGHVVVPSAPTASSMNDPKEVLVADGKLFIVDEGFHRVMVFNRIPDVNDAPADYFIGQSGPENGSKNAGGTSVNAIGFDSPACATVAHDSLFVCDPANHRLLVFTPVPSSSGTAASAVLGQDTLTSSAFDAMAPSATNLGGVHGVTVVDDHLFVADFSFNRVLRFTLRH
jgi:hypothetical protein